LVKYSRHLGEWNQFCGQAVSTFRSQTLGPHVTHILLCCYFMSGSIHLDTWQRGVPEVATYKVVFMETAITYRVRMTDCILTWDLHCRVYFEMSFSLRCHVWQKSVVSKPFHYKYMPMRNWSLRVVCCILLNKPTLWMS